MVMLFCGSAVGDAFICVQVLSSVMLFWRASAMLWVFHVVVVMLFCASAVMGDAFLARKCCYG
ncbi:hypothetical protein B0T26DRAFT_259572 [Lasiosphaeria miniovina]|uniref:Uncharacterized protein n=1 Tax=Lasiosphaeria miniovina TaxID=1954250 RepID=A0AA40AWQ1_9PEZI|nr:uncharacterized protein B0T26DRAFT_259572 [Lasiosphaeria miniovina]KAK0723372.1 hypothetical protein B0T26DRAFT_259572 [Lasiosphaeria miniovina]